MVEMREERQWEFFFNFIALKVIKWGRVYGLGFIMFLWHNLLSFCYGLRWEKRDNASFFNFLTPNVIKWERNGSNDTWEKHFK